MKSYVYISTSAQAFREAFKKGLVLIKVGKAEKDLNQRAALDAGDLFYHNIWYAEVPTEDYDRVEIKLHNRLEKYNLKREVTTFIRNRKEWFLVPVKDFLIFLKEEVFKGEYWHKNIYSPLKLQLEEWDKLMDSVKNNKDK